MMHFILGSISYSYLLILCLNLRRANYDQSFYRKPTSDFFGSDINKLLKSSSHQILNRAQALFSDWSRMKFIGKKLVRDQDYILVSQTVWMKLQRHFQALPEIGLYQVDKNLLSPKILVDRALGSTPDSDEIRELPDLDPIVLQVHNVDSNETNSPIVAFESVLVSKNIGVKNFINSVGS